MKKIVCLALSALLCLITTFSALAEIDLSEMSISELASLRDRISDEINHRTQSLSTIIIDCEAFTLEITAFEEGGKEEINDYFDLYKPGYGTSNDDRRWFICIFTITNKSDELLDSLYLNEASINGWMTSGDFVLQAISAHKKAKGIAYFAMTPCEAETIDDVQSLEFTITYGEEYWGEYFDYTTVQLIRSGDSFVLVQ